MVLHSGKIVINRKDLNLKLMLEGGQSFRWKSIGEETCKWIGVFRGVIWQLTQYDDHVIYTAHSSPGGVTTCCKSSKKQKTKEKESICYEKMLRDYLRVDAPLNEYYLNWSEKDKKFAEAAVRFHGLRMLDQDPVENLFSFICSSNNNIPRISSMVERMCQLYGEKICKVEDHVYHAFPSVERLSGTSVEQDLRTAGFGYRAKFIKGTASELTTLGGATYLESLKQLPYLEAKESLLKFPGIGPKVADCICLMSLGQFEAVPVDTHVFQVASQHYLPNLKDVKSVTDRVYKQIGDHFRELYGPLAGWAHSILFCADLKKFQLPKEKKTVRSSSKKASKRKIITESEEVVRLKRKSDVSEDLGEIVGLSCEDYVTGSSVVMIQGQIPVSLRQLHLRVTFNCGQTYRWKKVTEGVWRGVHADRVWTLRQNVSDSTLQFTCHYSRSSLLSSPQYPKHYTQPPFIDIKSEEERCIAILMDYFRLYEPVDEMYSDWSEEDPRFKEVASGIYGLRMTRQDIVENLFAFICSSNNTISRITYMMNHLCEVYGDFICCLDGEQFFTAPRLERLCTEEVINELKVANFGFRSSYIAKAARAVMADGGLLWFTSLINADYPQAKQMLMKLPGIGAKVADCICLTALDHLEAIPVDTHVFQIAKKYYLPQLTKEKTVSKRSYDLIGNHFRKLFGRYPGWAHTVLFCSELRSSADLLSEHSNLVSAHTEAEAPYVEDRPLHSYH